MRKTLVELFNNVVTLRYELTSKTDITKTIITTSKDFAFQAKDDKDVVELIYNGIVDLAFDDYCIDITKLNELQKISLDYRIRFNVGSEENQLKLGFYGEVLLNIFLQVFFGTEVFVARGEFYDLLSNSEAKGYDCHHIIQKGDELEFWFGEVKFYENYINALNNIWKNLNKDISFDYLNKNLQTIFQKKYTMSSENLVINKFINECITNPYRNLYEDVKRYNGKLVYPVLLVANEIGSDFNNTIKMFVEKINDLNNCTPIRFPDELRVDLFFIFLPVTDAKNIKKEVLKCIRMSEPII